MRNPQDSKNNGQWDAFVEIFGERGQGGNDVAACQALYHDGVGHITYLCCVPLPPLLLVLGGVPVLVPVIS